MTQSRCPRLGRDEDRGVAAGHPFKTQIQRRLKGQRQIEDTRDDPEGFYHASSVGFSENYQEEGDRCVVPGDSFDGMEFG